MPRRSFVAKRAPRELELDDLVQDIFVRIQAQLPTLRDAERVDAWICQIARNVVADAFRKRTRVDAFGDRHASEAAELASVDGGHGAEWHGAECE